MLTTPFLTDPDPQALVKGSRDPLGVQTIWARMGRHLVGNLTTVSSSLRGFTTLILGYYFAERVADEGAGDGDLGVFFRWELLAAYSRATINNDWNFLGMRRAKRALGDADRIRLSVASDSQILSNQKTYGLWGLYTVPSRASSLVEGDPTRLTASARTLVERVYLPVFAQAGFRNADEIVRRLSMPKTDLDLAGSDRKLAKAVALVLQPRVLQDERAFYEEHLLLGWHPNSTSGRQEILARTLSHTIALPDWSLSPARVQHLAKSARTQGGSIADTVADRLDRIVTAERLLAPSVRLFSFLLSQEGQRLTDIVLSVRKQWGKGVKGLDVARTSALDNELRDSTEDESTGRRWVSIASALASGDYENAIKILLEQNAFVMHARGGGASWADFVDNRLRVRFRDDAVTGLPTAAALRDLWVHPYFLDSVRSVAATLSV